MRSNSGERTLAEVCAELRRLLHLDGELEIIQARGQLPVDNPNPRTVKARQAKMRVVTIYGWYRGADNE